MQFKNLKLYRPVPNILIPPAGVDGKNICLTVLTENNTFLECYRHMNIKKASSRFVFVPTTKKPRTYLTPKYKKEILSHGLRAVKGFLGDYSKLLGKNFFLDVSTYFNFLISKFNFKKFNVARPLMFINNVLNTLSSLDPDNYQRVVLYIVNLDKPIPDNIRKRRIFPVYYSIIQWVKKGTELPFDKLLLFFYDNSGGSFVLLFDKDQPKKINLGRMRSILTILKSTDIETQLENEKDSIVDDSIEESDVIEDLNDEEKDKVKSSIKTFLKNDPSSQNITSDQDINHDELTVASIAYHITGDIDKSKTISKQLIKSKDKKTVEKVVKSLSKQLIKKPVVKSASTNEIIKMAHPEDLVDNQIPSHLLEKRKMDFGETLKEDIVNIFKPLESEELPIKVRNMEVKSIRSTASELEPTLKDRYFVDLEDNDGKIHKVHVDLPHLTDDGMFLVNGIPYVLVNQLITYPIFFYKAYYGRLQTVYSTLTVFSKKLAKKSYLMIKMAGYQLPIIMLFGYKIGFKETMDMFKIKYEIHPDKREDSIKINDQFITFKSDTDVGLEIIASFKQCVPYFPKSNKFGDTIFWRNVLVNHIGTRNCIYPIDQAWKFILTPTEKKILQSRGDPTELPKVLKYICEEVVRGRIDDRNSIDKQRIRTSEVFTHILQKQVISAYNEFLSKKLGGDESARMEVNSNKAYSEVINSPNIQLLESINPLEELSMMTRTTPVGIGGISDKRAFPQKAMNIHYTYYGNIDPLETPDGPMVGIQQHLTVGAALSNARGLFMAKDQSLIKPSEILSIGPAMIPFVSSNDGCRITMGTGQTKQAVPILNAEPAAVQSGYESLLTPLLSDNFIKKSLVNGEVVSIDTNLIIVKDLKTGEIVSVDTKPRLLRSGQGKHGLSKFKPIVKVGQKIKKNQILAEGSNIVDGMISNGINLLTAFMPWKGYNYEDGIVVSQSMADRFISTHIKEEKIYLDEDDDIIFITDIGDSIDKGGILLTYTKALYDVESYKHLRADGGIISNVEVYSNISEDKISEKLKPIYKRFRKNFISVHKRYPKGSFKEKNVKFDGIMIKFIMEQRLSLNKGDKLNNRHGNKGVVGKIEKDENMPITPWGEKIDIILNPLGIVGRMNNGQVLELHVGLISKKLAEAASSMKREAFIKTYQRVLRLLDSTESKSYTKNVIGKLKELSEGHYKKLIGQMIKNKFIPIIIPPFKRPTKDNILDALKLLDAEPRYPLILPEFKVKTDPVAVGYLYIQKLEHLSEKKIASRGVGGYVGKTLAPTAGKRKGGGQKIGEGDLYSLLAWDCPTLIEEFFGALSSDHVTKNEMIHEIIQNGSTDFKKAKTNPVKDQLNQMMTAILLESE